MSILVVCPGCRKSFQVNDKFAGKSGPCPNCKAPIQIPTVAQFAGGGKSKTGKLVTKPISRHQLRVNPVVAVGVAGSVIVVLAATWAAGTAKLFDSLAACAIGLLLISPPLVVAAYAFLRDDDLEPYRGMALYVRSAICGVAYTVLWGVFSYLISPRVEIISSAELWSWIFVVPILLMGAVSAFSTLDLEFSSGFFHYAFYLLVTIVLRWAAGLHWIWSIPKT
jgi:hypothetical protein